MKIFLSYGMLLGAVGAGLGTALGLALTININEVEQFLSKITGSELFPRHVYYFDSIPTDIQSWSIVLVNTTSPSWRWSRTYCKPAATSGNFSASSDGDPKSPACV